MNFYEDVEKMREILIECNNMACAEKIHNPESHRTVVLTRERDIVNELISKMSIERLHSKLKYKNVNDSNYKYYMEHPEIVERLSRGTLDEKFIHDIMEQHRLEYQPYVYLYIPTVVVLKSYMIINNNLIALLEDPFGKIMANISCNEDIKAYIGKTILANIGYNATSKPQYQVNKIRLLN